MNTVMTDPRNALSRKISDSNALMPHPMDIAPNTCRKVALKKCFPHMQNKFSVGISMIFHANCTFVVSSYCTYSQIEHLNSVLDLQLNSTATFCLS